VTNDEMFAAKSEGVGGFDYQRNPVQHDADAAADLEAVCAHVCSALGMTIEALQGKSRAAEVATARRAVAILAVEHLGHSVGEGGSTSPQASRFGQQVARNIKVYHPRI